MCRVHALRDGLPGALHRHRRRDRPETWPDREKYCESFVIDELRCIYCGMCEEACPVEAIELTGLYDLTGLSREQMIFDKAKLLSVFDLTKEAEPLKYGTPPSPAAPPPSTQTLPPLTNTRDPPSDRRDVGKSRPGAQTHVNREEILAVLVVVLGAAGLYLMLPHKHGATRPAHRAPRRLDAGSARPLALFAFLWNAPGRLDWACSFTLARSRRSAAAR